MQTFLPYDNFQQTAEILDRQRLGKQRLEVYQIHRALTDPTAKGWTNHPATLMWKGWESELCYYGLVMCREWRRRGYRDTLADVFDRLLEGAHPQAFNGTRFISTEFHQSHKLNLLWKNPLYYRSYWPDLQIPTQKPDYVWQ